MQHMIILTALQEEIPTLHTEDHVFVTGLGKVNAALHATRLILEHKPKLIVNFGTAGAVSDSIAHGLVECTGYVQRDMDCTPLGFDVHTTPFEEDGHLIGTPGMICGTGDSFLTDGSSLVGIDIVDMEAYAIAKVCLHFSVPFRCFKYISDSADENAGEDWATFEHAKAEKLFIEHLTRMRKHISSQLMK
jgi:adenosylhomocysteine nucleosidase